MFRISPIVYLAHENVLEDGSERTLWSAILLAYGDVSVQLPLLLELSSLGKDEIWSISLILVVHTALINLVELKVLRQFLIFV